MLQITSCYRVAALRRQELRHEAERWNRARQAEQGSSGGMTLATLIQTVH